MGAGFRNKSRENPGVSSFAPAKINLALHVTGRRADGYHLLDSLVVFTDVGDRIRVKPAPFTTFSVVGPQAGGVPVDQRNLVMRAAALSRDTADIVLEKHLPPASGIGGGSSDAAAALRAFAACFGSAMPAPDDVRSLGADVPVCLAARPSRITGTGEVVEPVKGMPPLHFVLVNPGVKVATPDVFNALSIKENGSMAAPAGWRDTADLAAWLRMQRNDLERPARAIAPAIGVVQARLAQTGSCLLARMSGSGATCFGLYASRPRADAAAAAIAAQHPEWWCVAASSLTSAPAAA